ncbi:MAG TPA: TolC family protein [Candidatus Acidoferrum sp.]|nr:TolC family protein [Candidatus Acidoferrum sp.]
MKKTLAILGYGMMFLTLACQAQPPREEARPLTLADAEQQMRDKLPALRAAKYAVDAAGADLVTAGEAPNPQFSVNTQSVSPNHSNGPGSFWNKQVDTTLQLQQQIERGDKRGLRRKVATAEGHAAAADFDDALRTSRMALAQAYYDLKYAQESEDIARKLFDLQQQSLNAAQLRLQAGDAASVDVARLEVEVARAATDLSTAHTAKQVAQLTLAQAIGATDAGTSLVAVDEWPAVSDAKTGIGVDQRPDVRAAAARNEQSMAAVELARSQQTRDVTVNVQYEHYPQPGLYPNTVGVGFSVPLFAWHHYQGEVSRAEADHMIAEEALRNTRVAAVAEQAGIDAQMNGARERLLRFRDAIVDKATAAAQAAEYAYSRGALGLTDLLDARRALQSVLQDAAAAKREYAKALLTWKAVNEANNGLR